MLSTTIDPEINVRLLVQSSSGRLHANSNRRSHGFELFKLVLLALFSMALLLSLATEVVQAQDSVGEGRNALSGKSYPWYDSKSDAPKRVEFGERPKARASNRESIPDQEIKPAADWDWDWSGGNWNWGGGANWGASGAAGLSAMVWAMLFVLVLVLVGILIWAITRMGSNPDLEDDKVPARTMEESIKQLPFDMETASGDFRSLAQGAYRDGDYRKAITFLFSHVLVSLDQKGLIRLRKGKTNRQYLSELRSHRPLANYYQHVMVPFEAAFFGDHELGQSEFESCWSKLDEFQNGVNQTSQVANV